MTIRIAGLIGATLLASSLASAAEVDLATSMRNIAATRAYSLGEPRSAKVTPDHKAVIFLRSGPRDPTLKLYELDIASGRERELLTPEQLLNGAAEVISAEEKSRRERARVSASGFTSFELSKDGAKLLLPLAGRLYLLDRASRQVTALEGEGWVDPHFAPNGQAVAAVAKDEVNIIDAKTGKAKAVTSGSTATIHNGVAEFAAQEEMDRREGFWWSPDSKFIAYEQSDDSAVPVRYIADPLRPGNAPLPQRYPAAGTANATVKLGVIPAAGGQTRWVSWDQAAFPYLARVNWDEPQAPLTILVQDRAQQNQVLLAVDAATGNTRPLLKEHDSAWLNLDRSKTMPHWVRDGSGLLWSTERAGQWQLELRDKQGNFKRFLTDANFGFDAFVAASDQFAYVLGSTDSRERQLWEVSLDGGRPRALTTAPGVHGAAFSDDAAVYVDRFNLKSGEVGAAVMSGTRRLGVLKSEAERPPLMPNVEVTRTTGTPAFDAAIVRPRLFEKGRRYPVILSVYAGPTAKMVTVPPRDYFYDQWMADHGYVVVRIDGRGTPGHGRDWERAIRGNFIDIALQDQVDGLTALAARYPEIDLSHVGVSGWSFGGYFSAMAVLRRPDIFKAASAGAPVVRWEDYDTHYTERYIGLPAENPEAYRVSDVTTYAKDLKQPLLIIHGFTDDNVYLKNSLDLIDMLIKADKKFEYVPLPGTHMLTDPAIRQFVEEKRMQFFDRSLESKAATQ